MKFYKIRNYKFRAGFSMKTLALAKGYHLIEGQRLLFLWSLVLLLYPPSFAIAQSYQINGVPLIQNGDTLKNAWLGGLNNPEFSPIDLNQDGLMDLFVYDKAGWKALSFINTGSPGHESFTYAPQYDRMYPSDLTDWAVIRDYNHDGTGDIFAVNNADGYNTIKVYEGFRNGSTCSYVKTYSALTYPFGVDTPYHHPDIYSFADNMPIIMDVDGDGAIDIVAPDVNAVNLDYFRNISVDSGYSPDSLVFVLQSSCWGRFAEDVQDCNVQLNYCQSGAAPPPVPADSRDQRHQGGACYGFHYQRGSNLTSAFIADIYCNTTKFLWNQGTTGDADMMYVDTMFPKYDSPVDIPLFPAVYGADMDNDGFEDLMAAPFADNANVPAESEDRDVVRYYHNNAGTDTINTYHLEPDSVFNGSMVDIGTGSHAVFLDYNGDGLMDIVVGGYGHYTGAGDPQLYLPGTAMSSLYLYKNIGTAASPVFQLEDSNWNNLAAYDSTGLLNGLFPAFGNLSGNGQDMVIGTAKGTLNYFRNAGTADSVSYPVMSSPNWYNLGFQMGLQILDNAAPYIYDVNGDGLNDLIVGSGGANACLTCSNIYYYWNFGTRTNPVFSPDSVNLAFGNIKLWDTSVSGISIAYPTPFISLENGTMVLYAGAVSGRIHKYAINPDSLRSGSFQELSSDVLGVSPGRYSNVSVADINGDGINDYLTGNIRGGIMLFSDAPWSSSSTNAIAEVSADENKLLVFPNPASDKVTCRFATTGAVLVDARLYDLTGECLQTDLNKQSDNSMTLHVGGLSNGVYIIRVRDGQGRIYQNKLCVYK